MKLWSYFVRFWKDAEKFHFCKYTLKITHFGKILRTTSSKSKSGVRTHFGSLKFTLQRLNLLIKLV